MWKNVQAAHNDSIDPAVVAAVTREVIARLRATTSTNVSAASVNARVISASTLAKISGSPTQVFIPANSIVTPAAVDEARLRGITLNRTVDVPLAQQPHDAKLDVADSANPERGAAVRALLGRRGEAIGSARIVLSDTPARDVYEWCAKRGEIAASIQSLADIQRFADELSPTVWVLDMQRLNIPAAVNAIAQIGNLSR